MLNIRHPGERFELRPENEWPLARTQWTEFYLDADSMMLREEPAAAGTVTYETMGDGVTFWLPTRNDPLEVTGPLAAKLFVSSETNDADLFLVLRLFDPDGDEVTFMGSTDPNTPIANGWLRASHRAIDPERSLPHRPFHPHDRTEPLAPGEVYECDIEFVATCIVVPPGYRLGLNVRGKDYEYTGPLSEFAQKFHYATRGTGGMTHADPDDRPPEVFDTLVTIHTGSAHRSHLLLPVIP
jgi:predicted acyl esterase